MNTDVQDRLIELFCKILDDLNEQGLRGEIFIEEGIDCEQTGFLPKASDDMYEVLRTLEVTQKAEITRVFNLGDQLVLELSIEKTDSIYFTLTLGIPWSDRESFFVDLTMNDEDGFFSGEDDREEYTLFSNSWPIPEKYKGTSNDEKE